MQMLKQENYTTTQGHQQQQQQQQSQQQYTLSTPLKTTQGQMLPPPQLLHQAGHPHHVIPIETSSATAPLPASTAPKSTSISSITSQQQEKIRAENRERKKRWREQNEDRNKDNDLRCRVNKRANKALGKEDSEAKTRWIEEEFLKRQQKRKEKERRKQAVNGAIGANPQLASLPSNQLLQQSTQATTQLPQASLAQLGLAGGNYYQNVNVPPLSPGTTAKLLSTNLAALKANKAGMFSQQLLQQLSSSILPEGFNLAALNAASSAQQAQTQSTTTQQNNSQGSDIGNGSSAPANGQTKKQNNILLNLLLGDLTKLSTPPSESVTVNVTGDGTFSPGHLSPSLLQTPAVKQGSLSTTTSQDGTGSADPDNNASPSAGEANSQSQPTQQQSQSQQDGQQGQQSSTSQQQEEQNGAQARRKPNLANAQQGNNPDYPLDAVMTLMQLNAGWRHRDT